MDPLSQAALGAACAQSTQKSRLGWLALLGALGGLAPDLDILINSDRDPLLFLEYHRQFSHSLVFIPLGGLLVAALAWRLPGQPFSFWRCYLACSAGYASHGLLDACTSYGTQLLWPFSDARISWNTVSVIDPLFTLPLLALMLLAIGPQRRWLARAGLIWALAYLLLGWLQQSRATAAAQQLASNRAHLPERLLVKPAFGNLLLWKAIYLHDGVFYVDGHRAAATVTHCGGASIPALNPDRDLADLPEDSQQRLDIERFRWFSMDYLAPLEVDGERLIIDVRYANLPHRIDPLWGIGIDSKRADQPVRWWSNRSLNAAQRKDYQNLLNGRGCGP
ncbi:MAG: metal-dependent hydrolase [Pseudomonadales bacterium]